MCARAFLIVLFSSTISLIAVVIVFCMVFVAVAVVVAIQMLRSCCCFCVVLSYSFQSRRAKREHSNDTIYVQCETNVSATEKSVSIEQVCESSRVEPC